MSWKQRVHTQDARPPNKARIALNQGDGTFYTLERAREAVQTIRRMDLKHLYTPGMVTLLPYPGIGFPPPQPGGDIEFVGMEDVKELLSAVVATIRSGPNSKILVSGPKGMGKSCRLRALACAMIARGIDHKTVCIWSMQDYDLVLVIKNALRFTYCEDDAVLREIDALVTVDNIAQFLKAKCDGGEAFYFIIDGAEILDPRDSRGITRDGHAAVKRDLLMLVKCGHICIYGLSPLAENVRNRNAEVYTNTYDVWSGFYGQELETYLEKVSVLGKLFELYPDRTDDFKYYAGNHPLSMALLDRCCRVHAQNRSNSEDYLQGLERGVCTESLTRDQVIETLADDEDWQDVIAIFQSSPEIETIRRSTRELLGQEPARKRFKIEDVMPVDSRFVVEDGEGNYRYATAYIHRIYTEELRALENEFCVQEGPWGPYCRYLLEQGARVNWSAMGWVCEHLVGDVLRYKGLMVDSMEIRGVRPRSFLRVPNYRVWKNELLLGANGSGIFFIPTDSNYPDIDGAIVWRDSEGKLHFLAIQITVDEVNHQESAARFMVQERIEEWISEKMGDWILHFLFICCEDRNERLIEPNIKVLRDNITYGTVGYRLHTVSFKKAMERFVQKDVIDMVHAIAEKRSEAGWKGRAAQVQAIMRILSLGNFTRPRLENLARYYNLAVAPASKESLKLAIAQRIATGGDDDGDGGATGGGGDGAAAASQRKRKKRNKTKKTE